MLIMKFYLNADSYIILYYIVVFMIGFFIGGPYNVISTAITVDLSK